jgi:hypothetical protein
MSIVQYDGPQCFSILKTLQETKCGKCKGGHKTKNYGLKCSYYFGLGHTEERCWKNGKGLPATTNYLEVLVNDEDATLT